LSSGKLLQSWRGFAYRRGALYWLLVSSLTVLCLWYFMPSSEQLEHIERGVGIWQRIFNKVNLIYALPIAILARRYWHHRRDHWE
jgi:hypothetical protein